MKRYPAVAAILAVATPVLAQVPSIEGTYRLVSRTLPDGTVQKAPQAIGLMTMTKTHRNMNIMWTDSAGKRFSLSQVSTYTLNEREYSESLLYQIINDEIGGKGLKYNTEARTLRSPVKVEGRSVQFKFPFEVPTVTFDGDKATATSPSGLRAVWEKIQ